MPTREPREVTESYRIEKVLKSSRSGIVFRASDPASGKPVVIKLIPPPPAAVKTVCHARFVALAELLTLLQPSGLPAMYDFGFTPDGSAFLVLELVDGARLDSVEHLAPARIVGIALSTLDTLAALANKGIQHGNLSPDNVLLGAGDRTWLVGLGTAALRSPGTLARIVLDGEAAEFAAPERFDAAAGGAVDWRGDLYSLALSVCSLLKAEVSPVDGPAPSVRLPFEVAKALRDPNILRTALEQALCRLPEDRPASYDVLREAFRRALGAAAAVVPAIVAPVPPPGPAPTAVAPGLAANGAAGSARTPERPASAPPAAPPAGAPPASVPPPASPARTGPEWEEPEGAPAWLQESSPAFVLDKAAPTQPAPLQPAPPPEPVRDDREDTNPVPLERKAELPLKARAEALLVVPPVGAPSPLLTPAVAAPSPPEVPPPPALPVTPHPQPTSPAIAGTAVAAPHASAPSPAVLAKRLRPLGAEPPPAKTQEPPAAPAQPVEEAPGADAAMPPRPLEATPAAKVEERPLDSTPPTGSYELPEAPAVTAEASPVATPEIAVGAPPAATPAVEASGPPAPAVAAPGAKPPQAKRQRTPAGTRRRWLVGALALAAVVLVGAVGVFVGMQVMGSRQAVPATPPPAPTRPRPTAQPQTGASPAVLANIVAAEQAVASADLSAAQAALDAITGDDELTLGPSDLGRLTRARAAVNGMRLDGVLSDLRTGLATGNLKLLRDAVRRITREDEAALAGDPDSGQTLDEARRAVNLFGLATKAQQAGNDAQLLQHATALLELTPKSAQAADLRDRAASGLEREADALVQRGRFDDAIERLATLGRYWSARPGLAQRIERARADKTADQRFATALAQAEQAERDRQPDRGLELLRSIAPPPYYEERFRQQRGRLEALLQQLDANPPVVEIPPALKLEYAKNKPFVLTIRITDDHGVRSATLFARVKGADHYVELPLVRGPGGEWRGEITPGIHQNKAVELYIVASDASGHTGQAGSAGQPILLKKKWSLFGM